MADADLSNSAGWPFSGCGLDMHDEERVESPKTPVYGDVPETTQAAMQWIKKDGPPTVKLGAIDKK